MPFGLAPLWKYLPDVAVYLKGRSQVDINSPLSDISAPKRGIGGGSPSPGALGTLEGKLREFSRIYQILESFFCGMSNP